MHEPGAVVLSAAQVAGLVDSLAAQVAAAGPTRGDQPLVLLCVLKGSLVLTADLGRALHQRGVGLEIHVVAVRSYAGEDSGGTAELVKDVGVPLGGRDVLIIEDVVDTGLTAAFLLEQIRAHRPARLRLLTLLDKPGRHSREIPIDFRGTVIGDEFVVGYGLDLDERWRELPDIRLLRRIDPSP